jgi:hypothetical protein
MDRMLFGDSRLLLEVDGDAAFTCSAADITEREFWFLKRAELSSDSWVVKDLNRCGPFRWIRVRDCEWIGLELTAAVTGESIEV